VTDLHLQEGSIWPRYGSHCLSNVTSTLLSILGVENGRTKLPGDVFDGVDTGGVQNVVLFVFDGLGLNEWERQVGEGFFGAMARNGRTTPITSVFPSTTSTALTTLTTGLTPQEHSLIEWFMYLPEADAIIQTLPFSPMDSKRSNALAKVDPEVLVTGEPVFPRLAWEDIAARSYLSRYISRSAYSELMHVGSEVQPYVDAADLSVMLRKKLEGEKSSSFHYVYLSSIDTLEHAYGPGSEESQLEAANISGTLKRGLLDTLDRKVATKTLFVLTADHGHVRTTPADTTWLESFPYLVKSFAENRTGSPLLPWGAPRDVYMQVEKESLDEVCGRLTIDLAGKATVLKTKDAVSAGVFGTGSPTRPFLQRTGNLMVLPHGKKTAWYHHPGVERPELTGQHGGMHPDEMLVPFSAARASSVLG